MSGVRPAAVAGSFYPDEPRALQRSVADYLAPVSAAAQPGPCPKMLVVPHAGYIYSGPVAAHAYAQLAPHRARIRRVVLLGPVHRVPVRGLAAPSVEAFDTPLGRVQLDRAALAGLADLPQLLVSDRAHAAEHSLEVQLPFLQQVLGSDFRLVPLAVGDASPAQVEQVLERLWGGDETLIVISSDLSHYLPYAQARERDAATLARIAAFATDLHGEEACGASPLNGALRAARRHGLQPRVLDARNSGDTAGSRDRVVGYAALAFLPPETADRKRDADGANEQQSSESASALGSALLATARASIAGSLGLAAPSVPAHPALLQLGASFVTLHDLNRELRGCIGQLEATRPLGEDVHANARAAAFRDPRFAPVSAVEFDSLQLEVSVLSPMQAMAPAADLASAAAQLRPGIDGALLHWRGRRGTFLPQVWSQLPQREDFMRALLRKSGLPTDFWAADVQLWRYQVQAFEEAPA